MYNKAVDVWEIHKKTGKEVWEIAIEKDIENTGLSREELLNKLRVTLQVMKQSAYKGLDEEIWSISGITGGNAKKLNEFKDSSISGSLITRAMAMALSVAEVNASMGRIVAAPTAGSSGIVPACLFTMQEKYNYTDEELLKAMITAGVIGQIIAQNASISGAEGGCQAECGTASAMGAAAICYLRGYELHVSFAASSFAIKNVLGLVCDPICGLVEYPCNLRNANGVVNAIISADLAMAGMQSLIPLDETIDAMRRVGGSLPEALRETALGGVATTPTAKKIEQAWRENMESNCSSKCGGACK